MMGESTRIDPKADECLKWALEHARALYIYHAGQRIASVNYYFVAIAVLLAGFAHIVTATMGTPDRAILGAALSLGGIFLTTCFKQLDKRNEQLVDCDATLLQRIEKRMSEDGLPEWQVTQTAQQQEPLVRYRKIVPMIFFLYVTLCILGGIYAVWPWVSQR